jgi:hypothetical protein
MAADLVTITAEGVEELFELDKVIDGTPPPETVGVPQEPKRGVGSHLGLPRGDLRVYVYGNRFAWRRRSPSEGGRRA